MGLVPVACRPRRHRWRRGSEREPLTAKITLRWGFAMRAQFNAHYVVLLAFTTKLLHRDFMIVCGSTIPKCKTEVAS